MALKVERWTSPAKSSYHSHTSATARRARGLASTCMTHHHAKVLQFRLNISQICSICAHAHTRASPRLLAPPAQGACVRGEQRIVSLVHAVDALCVPADTCWYPGWNTVAVDSLLIRCACCRHQIVSTRLKDCPRTKLSAPRYLSGSPSPCQCHSPQTSPNAPRPTPSLDFDCDGGCSDGLLSQLSERCGSQVEPTSRAARQFMHRL